MENISHKDLNMDLYNVKTALCGANSKQIVTMINSGMQYRLMVWIAGDNLLFFPYLTDDEFVQENVDSAQLKLTRVNLSSIDYYDQEGEEHYEQIISGGGGGGSSLGGALIGGMLFGDVGAIIGSRKKIEEIKTETVHHDNRITVMSYLEGNEHKKMIFSHDSYDVFFAIIPQYDRGVIRGQKASVSSLFTVTSAVPASASLAAPSNNIELLKQLKQLHDDGVLTDEEFAQKKREIMDRM